MGGFGSGKRLALKITTKQLPRIDVRYMNQRGLLQPGRCGNLAWACRGRPSGEISYHCDTNVLQLNYRHRDSKEKWLPVEQQVDLLRTHCHYGGERTWFACPGCQRRVGVIYRGGRLFLCRHCYHLPYRSQQLGYLDNLIEKKHELGRQIFAQYEGGQGDGKKKGMHWKTFDKKIAIYRDMKQLWLEQTAKQFRL